MNTITGKYSLRDRQKLAKAFQDQVSAQHNHEVNHQPDEFQKKMMNEQYHWVKQSEIFKEEERRKRFAKKVKPIRALRDGENSLVSLITTTLSKSTDKINSYETTGYISKVVKSDMINNICMIEDCTNAFANELAEIENNIELAKSQNQIILDAERVLLQLSKLKETGELNQAQQLYNHHSKLLQSYKFQRYSIMPLIESARHQRTSLQRQYWRCMSTLWSIHDIVCQKDLGSIYETIETIVNHTLKLEKRKEMNIAQHNIDDIYERKVNISGEVPSNLNPDEDEGSIWEKIIPSFSHLNVELEFMVEVLQTIKYKVESCELFKSTQPSTRMVYTGL